MTEYDKLLNEARAKTEAFSKSTAKEYIPKMYWALRNENPNLTPEDARVRIENCSIEFPVIVTRWSIKLLLNSITSYALNN